MLEMLIRNVGTIGLEGTPGFGDELEAMEKEKLEAHAVYNERDGFGWRFHSCISNVRREWRYCYRVNGHALHMSDVANSQPLVLASVLRERGVQDCDEYVRLCEEGTIYDRQRRTWARAGRRRRTGSSTTPSTAGTATEASPTVPSGTGGSRTASLPSADFVKDVKRTDYARLSRMLQRQESKIVLYTACESLVLEEDVFLAPIHDALLYLPEHRATVEGRLRQAFARYGVGVTVKHVSYEKNEDRSLHPLPITDKQGNGYASITIGKLLLSYAYGDMERRNHERKETRLGKVSGVRRGAARTSRTPKRTSSCAPSAAGRSPNLPSDRSRKRRGQGRRRRRRSCVCRSASTRAGDLQDVFAEEPGYLCWFYDAVDGNEELKQAIAALPEFPARLAKYRERRSVKHTLEETIEDVVTRMFRVEPTQGEIDTLCDELFHQDGD